MGNRITVAYYPDRTDARNYEARISLGRHRPTRVIAQEFTGCLRFILKEYMRGLKSDPFMSPIVLEVTDQIPDNQRRILESIVEIHNKIPHINAEMLTRGSLT